VVIKEERENNVLTFVKSIILSVMPVISDLAQRNLKSSFKRFLIAIVGFKYYSSALQMPEMWISDYAALNLKLREKHQHQY